MDLYYEHNSENYSIIHMKTIAEICFHWFGDGVNVSFSLSSSAI